MLEFMNRDTRPDEVVVFGDVEIRILAEPSGFAFNLDPSGHLEVDINAGAVESLWTGFGNTAPGIIRLKG